MNFYKIHVNFGSFGHYVYYRSQYSLPIKEVAWHACWEGDLIEEFLQNVDIVVKISSEEYFEYMYE